MNVDARDRGEKPALCPEFGDLIRVVEPAFSKGCAGFRLHTILQLPDMS